MNSTDVLGIFVTESGCYADRVATVLIEQGIDTVTTQFPVQREKMCLIGFHIPFETARLKSINICVRTLYLLLWT